MPSCISSGKTVETAHAQDTFLTIHTRSDILCLSLPRIADSWLSWSYMYPRYAKYSSVLDISRYVDNLKKTKVTIQHVLQNHSRILKYQNKISTVYSRYIAVGGVQAMVSWYKWQGDISGDCHEPKSDSILQHVMNDNGAFVCLAANSTRRQLI